MSNKIQAAVQLCQTKIESAYTTHTEPLNFSEPMDEYWQALKVIVASKHQSLQLAHAYVSDNDPLVRLLGLYIFYERFNPTDTKDIEDAHKMIRVLSKLAASEKVVSCLIMIAHVLGRPHMHEAEPTLIRLSKSKKVEIRFAATQSLGSTTLDGLTTEWTTRMIALSHDEDDDIRDWATMHLGSEKNPAITEALVERLIDCSIEVRTEAINGLANLGDTRGVKPLQAILLGEIDRKDIESAGLYGLPELLPFLDGLHTDDSLLHWAQARCDPNPSIKNSVDDEWLDEETYQSVLHKVRRPIRYKEWDGTGSPWED